MQNQLLTDTAPEQSHTPPTTTQVQLAAEETQTSKKGRTAHEWIAKIGRKAQRDKRMFWGYFVFFQASLFVPVCLTNTFPIMRNGHLNLVMLAMMILPSFGMAALALWFIFRKRNWNAEELTRVGGVQAVGALLELLGTPQLPRRSKPLFVALIQLLPQMSAGEAVLLTAGQRKLLYTLLKGEANANADPDLLFSFRLTVIKALEQIGDADAIPIVEYLANGKARTAHQEALKAAAIECLPLLLVNFSNMEATKTLMRASSPESSAPETLLRPVGSTPDANRNQLLHAVNTPSLLPPA